MTVDEKEILSNLKRLLKIKGVQVKEAAKHMGYTPTNMTNKLRGHTNITVRELLKLTKFLEVPIRAVFFPFGKSTDREIVEYIEIIMRGIEMLPASVRLRLFKGALATYHDTIDEALRAYIKDFPEVIPLPRRQGKFNE